jgi:transcriptional regulator GlxA family with amidase domain
VIPVRMLLPPRSLLLDVAGPLEVLRRANMEQDSVYFDVRCVGVRPELTSSVGLNVTGLDPLPADLPDEAIIIVSGAVDTVAFTERASDPHTERADENAIVEWLRARVRPDHLVVSICSGALLAAHAGLLDGHVCTTHYSCCAELARLAPRARVVENRLYVEDGNRCTSAGVTAGIDLMLRLVERYIDSACALAVARHLVVYLRRTGADPQLSPWLEGRNHIHPVVHRAQDAIAADPARDWSLSALAPIASTSARHLSRLFNEHVGMSLSDYVNRLRIALARELLGNTRLDMEHVAERSGFASTRQLRRAWRRLNTTPPSEARPAHQDPDASPRRANA